MKKQPIESQMGEISFRKKLYLQQIENVSVFKNEFDGSGIESILKDRMIKTRDQMSEFQKKSIPLSPFIEIGAERCQRSLVMENDLGLNGAAVDISYEMLKSCVYYKDLYKKSNSPLRVCCDANKLPFLTNSIPFVFCYETLHHFPEPAPIMKEIYRVLLPGGYFFFDEEPYKQVLHFNLYKGQKIYSQEALKRNRLMKVFDRLFCERSCNETEHGIIENDNISLKLWKKAIAQFDEKDIKLETIKGIVSDLFHPASYLKYSFAQIFGGTISGICRKAADGEYKVKQICDTIICPTCRESGQEVHLIRENTSFACSQCSKIYPVIDQVLFLFTYDKFAQLYPEIFSSFQESNNYL